MAGSNDATPTNFVGVSWAVYDLISGGGTPVRPHRNLLVEVGVHPASDDVFGLDPVRAVDEGLEGDGSPDRIPLEHNIPLEHTARAHHGAVSRTSA